MKVGKLNIKPGGLILILVLIGGLLYFAGSKLGVNDKIYSLVRGNDSKSVVVEKREKVEVDVSKIPHSDVKAPERTTDDPDVTIGVWTWQTEDALADAVGGSGSSGDHPDSPLAQAGITHTKLLVQNDTSEQAKLMSTGNMQIMTTTGDQSAVDINGLNNLLGGKYGKAVFSLGYSWGEDCGMMPESIMADPQRARGIVLSAAVPYCDWNVVADWAVDQDPKIGINPDESTYDPDAINFVNAVDHIEAAQKYVNNAKVALKNTKTGQMEEHEINGTATWTPGDVTAVHGRPTVNYRGKTEKLQKIISTRQYDYMMPNILVVDIRWATQHRAYLNTLFRVLARSNEKIQNDTNYLRTRVTPLAALLFNANNANYWYTYFQGNLENGVPLGGSRVNNISEIRHLFGMDQGVTIDRSIFGITYTDHGNRLHKIMPDKLPSFAQVADVTDTSFIRDITSEKSTATNYKADYAGSTSDRVVVATNFQINFDNNSAVIRPSEVAKLRELMSLLIRAGNTKVLVEGHTDSSGDANHNLQLSQQRAQSVWNWLVANDTSGIITKDRLIGQPLGFGPYRILEGHDPSDPANRRVAVTLR